MSIVKPTTIRFREGADYQKPGFGEMPGVVRLKIFNDHCQRCSCRPKNFGVAQDIPVIGGEYDSPKATVDLSTVCECSGDENKCGVRQSILPKKTPAFDPGTDLTPADEAHRLWLLSTQVWMW